MKDIDAILEDLNKIENPQNVKQLISKFDSDGEEVVLRKNFKFVKSQSDTRILDHVNRNSEDLNKLLEELGKVTCAPIMPPGVTSSLVTPTMTDDEVCI